MGRRNAQQIRGEEKCPTYGPRTAAASPTPHLHPDAAAAVGETKLQQVWNGHGLEAEPFDVAHSAAAHAASTASCGHLKEIETERLSLLVLQLVLLLVLQLVLQQGLQLAKKPLVSLLLLEQLLPFQLQQERRTEELMGLLGLPPGAVEALQRDVLPRLLCCW